MTNAERQARHRASRVTVSRQTLRILFWYASNGRKLPSGYRQDIATLLTMTWKIEPMTEEEVAEFELAQTD